MNAEYRGAIWHPSPNHGGRDGLLVVAIVMHITDGPLSAVLDWFSRLQSRVSSHFTVAKDGSVYQHVALANAAWGAGIDFRLGYDYYRSDRSLPWIDRCWRERINPNLVTVHVEHEGRPGDGLTEPQYAASRDLTRWLCREFDITPTGEFIVGHNRISAVQRANCPGPRFPWLRLLDSLTEDDVTSEQRSLLIQSLHELWSWANMLEDQQVRLRGVGLEAPVLTQVPAAIKEQVNRLKDTFGVT